MIVVITTFLDKLLPNWELTWLISDAIIVIWQAYYATKWLLQTSEKWREETLL